MQVLRRINVFTEDKDGQAVRSNSVLSPFARCVSPLKDASGWQFEVPEGAKDLPFFCIRVWFAVWVYL